LVQVTVRRVGALRGIGHDVVLHVEASEVTWAAATSDIIIRVNPAHLRAEQIADGNPLSERDRATIEDTLRERVLHVQRFPEIRFLGRFSHGAGAARRNWPRDLDGMMALVASGEVSDATIAGTLHLHGVARPLALAVVRTGGALVADFDLHQPDFGIRPYSTLLGALRVAPQVHVRVEVAP
jgi:polyisoprenoid-binding protein YceI